MEGTLSAHDREIVPFRDVFASLLGFVVERVFTLDELLLVV